MTISRQVNADRDLTVFTLHCQVDSGQIMAALREFWHLGPITRLVLWDAGGVERVDITGQDVMQMVEGLLADIGPVERRSGGKTAVAAPTDLHFGLARMFDGMRSIIKSDLPWKIKVFRERGEAMAWLLEGENG